MAEQELQILQGTIQAVVYQNYENGYSVLRLSCRDGQTATVVGTIPLPVVGEQLLVTGKWSSHSNYGRQFEAEFLERLMPQTALEIQTYLASRVIKGIGPRTAARIVAKFGDDTLRILEQEPERLSEVSGISLQKAKEFGAAFRTQVGLRNLLEFFNLHHLPAELAVLVYKRYGEYAVDLLCDDPYLLMDEEWDAPFGAVDRFAIEMGVAGDDIRRIQAGLLFELRYNRSGGHSFLPEEKLAAATAQLLTVEVADTRAAMEQMLEEKKLYRDTLAGISVIYLPALYQAECFCTRSLLAFAQNTFPTPRNFEKILASAASAAQISYSPQQETAIREAATSGLLLLTGGPGTGKTTIVNGILSLYDKLGIRYALAAPTGRAAQRITEVTGRDASTIHRLLEAGIDPATGKLFFQKDQSDPLDAEAVIVDEMSMVDIELLYHLLSAIRPGTRLVLVGDPDQLPPVGPGSPFRDMLRSNLLPSVRLTQIFRQAQESLIVMNAHRVNQGQMPELKNVKNDFFFLPARSEMEAADLIRGLCATRLPTKMGIPSGEIQVLSPTKKGGAGTVNLNRLLQESLNPFAPNKKEHRFGEVTFREGDRVMQIRNNYDILWQNLQENTVGNGIFNGDVGTILEVDLPAQLITVDFDGRVAGYEFNQLNELEPAYAMTVHKSQGSEYRAVVLSAWNASPYLLSRSILYTAITRARELLVIVGREETVRTMTENANTGRRYTGLKLRLQRG